MQRGFTLIELFVVVLIIGILSAIALPQYQKAVDKVRLSNLIPLVKWVKTEQEAFFLANGNYAANCEDLGLDLIPGTFFNTNHFLESSQGDFILRCTATKATGILIDSSKSNLVAYAQTYDKTDNPGQITCWSNNTERYKKLCSSVCGVPVEQQINGNGQANGFGCQIH